MFVFVYQPKKSPEIEKFNPKKSFNYTPPPHLGKFDLAFLQYNFMMLLSLPEKY